MKTRYFSISGFLLDHHIPVLQFYITLPQKFKFSKTVFATLDIEYKQELKFLKQELNTIPFIQDNLYSYLYHNQKLSYYLKHFLLDHLSEDIIQFESSTSYGYFTDFGFTDQNIQIIQEKQLNFEALFIESYFLSSDAHLAEKHKHLTREQAQKIASLVQSKYTIWTHFSKRYQKNKKLL